MHKVEDALFELLGPRLAQLFGEVLEAKLAEHKTVYPELVPIKVASEITGYSVNSLYQMKHNGKVPGVRKIGGKLMFESATLREWVRSGATPNAR